MCGSCGSSFHCWGRETEEHWRGCYGLSLGVSWGFRTLTAGHCMSSLEKRLFKSSAHFLIIWWSLSFSHSVCLTLCNSMDYSTPGFPVFHHLPELAQTHVHWVSDAPQPSHLLLSPSTPAFNLSQHQGLFKWVNSLHQVAKVLEFQLQHQSFQWTFRTDFL